MKRSRGFTLVEMLIATVLAAILMGGVLAAAGALSLDRRRMEGRQAIAHSAGMMEVIRRDLANGAAMVRSSSEGFELVGFGGIDPKTLAGDQRLVRIAYRVARGGVLVREQAYLDDPIRPQRWREVVATGVRRVVLTPLSAEVEQVRVGEDVVERMRAVGGTADAMAVRVPGRVRVRIDFADGVADREMVLR
jgi:prepilin-type N-terminal cleavage/methylation domain-containing protein